MRVKYLLLLISAFALLSCKKESSNGQRLPPSDAKEPVILLKEIVIPNLPSPYYHFEYNADSSISFASFASDLTRYHVKYVSNRISELINDIPGFEEKLEYVYDNSGKVNSVNYLDVTGAVYIKVFFSYDGQKLIKLERQRRLGSDFVVNKTLSFSYYADGNLKEMIDHRPLVPNRQEESTTSDKFENYDNKVNVDGFTLIHNDFFDHLILLPGVRLQRNNPRKEVFTSAGLNYEVDYTYTYNSNDLPLAKDGQGLFTAGASLGQSFQTNSSYSYY